MSIRAVEPTESHSLRIGGEEQPIGESTEAAGPSFGGVLEKTLEAANTKELDAVSKADALAAGKLDDLHGTMIAMKEAEISLKLVGSVRNKLMDAFHELWRTSV